MAVCVACGTETAAQARFCFQCGARLDVVTAIAPDLREGVLTTLRAEHRLVTVVFADMTGSVRRTRDLDAEGATALVNPLLETMVELMVQHGGRIDRFLGDGVLAVFGVPAAHEDDPIRAVQAAIGLRERAVGLGLDVTVGVNTGRVYFGPVGSSLHEELTVMGPVVNLAARLQGAASTGEVLVGASTSAHIHAAFELTGRTIHIKGIDDPVDAFVVNRPASAPDKVRGVEGLTSHIIGREAEFATLIAAVDQPSSMVAVIGEAGLGKSRLAAELRSATPRRWIEGRCHALSSSVPFSGFIDLLGRNLDVSDGNAESITAELSRQAALSSADIEEIVPFLAHLLGYRFGDRRDLVVDETEPDLRRRLTIDALVRWLVAVADSGAIVVFVDDLHWADPLTVDTIAGLQGAYPGLTVMVASRPDPGWSLVDLREAAPAMVEVRLGALSDDQTVEMVRRLLAVSGLPSETESRVVGWAGGNPFYVEELIRSMIDREMIVYRDGQWRTGPTPVRLELPESIDALVMSRFDRLPTDPRRAGQIAAVIERPFTDDLFEAVAGDQIARTLDRLTEAEFIQQIDESYLFTHDLVREAVYSSLLPSQKLELHELVAETILRLDPDDAESLAFHYDRSDNHLAAVERLHVVAVKAFEAYANDAAASHLERGFQRIGHLTELERDRWSAAYLILRTRLRERRTEYAEALSDLTSAAAIVDHGGVELAEILTLTGRVHRLLDSYDDAHAALDAAEAIIDVEQDPAAWIELQAERARALYEGGRGRELPDLIERVKPVVEREGTAAQHADLLGLAAFGAFIAEQFRLSPATVDICQVALQLVENGADPGRNATSIFRLGFCLLWADRSTEAIELLERGVREAKRIGDVMLETRATSYLAIALRRAAVPGRALDVANDAHEIALGVGDDFYMGNAEAVRGWAHWRLGRVDEGSAHCRTAIENWGTVQREEFHGANTEFAWLAAWPLCAIATHRRDYADAADHLALIDVPWERPMPEDLARAVLEVRRSPGSETLSNALRLAENDKLL